MANEYETAQGFQLLNTALAVSMYSESDGCIEKLSLEQFSMNHITINYITGGNHIQVLTVMDNR